MMVKAINNGSRPAMRQGVWSDVRESEGFAPGKTCGMLLTMAVLTPPLDERLDATVPTVGFDPESLPPGWLEPLLAAGVPCADHGEAWPARIDPESTKPAITAAGDLILPPLEYFRTLTSLPLKPVRTWIHHRYGIRLRVASGVHLWLWRDRLAVVNHSSQHRSGFLHGPHHGMRTVIALDPGRHQVVTW
jgi:hypothetical protein